MTGAWIAWVGSAAEIQFVTLLQLLCLAVIQGILKCGEVTESKAP